jgi:hemoglobin
METHPKLAHTIDDSQSSLVAARDGLAAPAPNLRLCLLTQAPIVMTMETQFDTINEVTIITLVDRFYAEVRKDPTLGPVFTAAIMPDAWPAHLKKMYAFWSSVMLTSGRYKGNPVAVHQQVAGITPPLFGQWLDLFEATARGLFVPAIAEDFAIRARRIAESLKLALFFRPDKPWTEDLRHRQSAPPI